MTGLGYILVPIGLAAFAVSERALYRLFVFWSLFSATAVMNFGEGLSASALQVWMYFGALWLARLVYDRLPHLSIPWDRQIFASCLLLTAFVSTAVLSLAMPIYINGDLLIDSPILGDYSATPLHLTSHNVTQVIYLIFGGLITLCVAHVNLSPERRQESEKILLCSAVFVSAWGILQFICNFTGVPYPDFIFNNSGSVYGQGFRQTLDKLELGRISSTAVEPSIFAQSILSLLPLCIPAILKRGAVFSILRDRSSALLMLVALVFSTSSTAYLGIPAVLMLLLLVLVRTNALSAARAWFWGVLLGVGGALAAAAAFVIVPAVRDIAGSVLLDKSESASALERVMTITQAYGYFRKYPVLGIGWGSATSHDLIVMLLANVGIIGTLLFLAAMGSVLRANWRSLQSIRSSEDLSRTAWFLCLASFLLTSVLIGFPLPFGNFWILLGIALSMTKRRLSMQLPEAEIARV